VGVLKFFFTTRQRCQTPLQSLRYKRSLAKQGIGYDIEMLPIVLQQVEGVPHLRCKNPVRGLGEAVCSLGDISNSL
jgi:hypothetical protein